MPQLPPSQPPVPDQPAGGSTRRQWLAAQVPLALLTAAQAVPTAAHALPARALVFPRDHGSHPDLRTEWWYITGYAQAQGRLWGFQVTFFRSRVDITQSLASAFAAKQLLFAHAALTDVQGQRLVHDQRIARAGFGVAQASESNTRIRLHDWTLERTDGPPQRPAMPPATQAPDAPQASRYTTHIEGSQFNLDLVFDSTQPLLLQGAQGLSRKGPQEQQASYYYSQPQLAVSGSMTLAGRRMAITPGTGRAWMDHEWSQALLHPDAVGWDWTGMNLHDGSALTVFQLRRADGSALWTGGSWRAPGQPALIFGASDVVLTAERWWTSPDSGARYPVRWALRTPAGRFVIQPLLDAQELDSSASTGSIYWEGLSDLLDSTGQPVGRGYLEMTGYKKPLRL